MFNGTNKSGGSVIRTGPLLFTRENNTSFYEEVYFYESHKRRKTKKYLGDL